MNNFPPIEVAFDLQFGDAKLRRGVTAHNMFRVAFTPGMVGIC